MSVNSNISNVSSTLSSLNTTYYVDINSQYRDLERYQNPADFAVTFKTFTGTGEYSQGLPLNAESFFQLSSIDPDFRDADLEVYGGAISQVKRFGDSTIFCCGWAYNGTPGLSFFYRENYIPYSNILPNTASPWIAKISTIFTNGEISGYSVDWIVYFDNPSAQSVIIVFPIIFDLI